MPTIPDFAESRNRLPEAPPSTDINPEKFGKDAAALSNLGGELGEFGGRLMAVRKRAIESDAVATAQTESLLEFSQFEEQEKTRYQQELSGSNGNVAGIKSPSEALKEKMEKSINARLKSMPTGDAQSDFLERIQPIAARSYLGNMQWENDTRAKAIIQNLDTRGNLVSQDLFKNPSLARATDHLASLREDLNAKAGTVLDQEQAEKAYKSLGKGYTASLIEGLANGTEMDAKYGRELLKNLPPEMKELVDAGDIERFSKRFDQADNERKQQFEINKAAQKEALHVKRDQTQDAILADIYEGRATVKDIIHGKGAILDPDKKQTMLNILKARQFEPKVPNQEALRSVVGRIYADPEDPKRITSEDQILKLYASGGLSWQQKQQAISEFRGKNSPQGQIEGDLKKQLFKQAENALVKKNSMGMEDPDGAENMAKFTSFALTEIEAARKAGKPVRELLDANSKNYLGNALKNYQKTPQQLMKSTVERMKVSRQAEVTKSNIQKPPAPDMVSVIDPKGRRGFIPKENLDKALKRGFHQFKSEGRKPQSTPTGLTGNDEKILTLRARLSEVVGSSADDERKRAQIKKDINLLDSDRLQKRADDDNLSDLSDDERNYLKLYNQLGSLPEGHPLESRLEKDMDEVWDALQEKKQSDFRESKSKPGKDNSRSNAKKTKVVELKSRKATKAELEAMKKNPGKW